MEPHASEARDALVPPPLRALLHQIVDYAGLFPPAALPLGEALQNYARYRQEPEVAWMLARFVHPTGRLAELDAYAELFAHDPPFRFSVLGTGGVAPDAFLDALDGDLRRIEAFHDRHLGRTLADVMEVRLPRALHMASAGEAEAFFDRAHRRVVAAGLAELSLFYEVPLSKQTPQHLPALLAAMAEHNSRQAHPLRAEAGLKVRCGSAEPEDIPTPAALAFALSACRNAGVRMKATAGLHHPIRHYDEDIGAPMHGFLNVFGAAALAYTDGLPAEVLEDILREENPEAFQFSKDAFHWHEHAAPLGDLARARETLAVSFGSCSFEEPLDGLHALELL